MSDSTQLEKQVYAVIKSALGDAIRKQLGDSYSSPLKSIIQDSVKVHDQSIRSLLYGSISELLADDEFKATMRNQIKHKVAKEITNTFGEGVFKRSINQLKSDPTLKARCIVAVEQLIEGVKGE